MTTVAVAQFGPTTDTTTNLETITILATEAKNNGADLVVFPEYSIFTNPLIDHTFIDNAEPLDGNAVKTITALSADLGIAIIFGMNEKVEGKEKIHNTLLGINNGEIQAVYRKIHLYDAFGVTESAVVEPGAIEEPQLFTVSDLTIGLQTCYDLRFPEISRRLLDAGANTIALPAEWVPGPQKEYHWETLLRARAIENTVFVIAADQTPPHGVGHSTILSPSGVPLTSLGPTPGTAQTTINVAEIDAARTTNPAIHLRRFSVKAGANV